MKMVELYENLSKGKNNILSAIVVFSTGSQEEMKKIEKMISDRFNGLFTKASNNIYIVPGYSNRFGAYVADFNIKHMQLLRDLKGISEAIESYVEHMPFEGEINAYGKFVEFYNFMNGIRQVEMQESFDDILEDFKIALSKASVETSEHCERLAYYNEAMGKALGLNELELNEIRAVGWLHDIGKIAIQDEILKKPTRLTEKEWERMIKHPEIGYRMLKSTGGFERVALGVKHHHERWDGKGYPDKLREDNIPFYARVMCITDSFDAMMSKRVYKEAFSMEYTITELLANKGKQFDPKLVDLFVDLIRQGELNKHLLEVVK